MTTVNQTTDTNEPDWAIGGRTRLDQNTTAIVQLVDDLHVRFVIDEGSDDRRHRYEITFDAAAALGSLLTALSHVIRPAGITRPAIAFTEVQEFDK
ncbi:hypothetical protein BH93_02315 [Rhodococcoides fascians A25f]|uniref:hypothetical protein n=1 Tax=Rhodococcoides fascians TaxID=1828 RepID=UPI0012D2AA28|nr:hypothetical protein [Rhodococcus fascians]QII04349.1 hypothetical protein BH93_02315 [Rhodococcus fascians A25f]